MNKIPQPKLCDNCEAELLRIMDNSSLAVGNIYCEENNTLGVLHIDDNRWDLFGPLSREEAEKIQVRTMALCNTK